MGSGALVVELSSVRHRQGAQAKASLQFDISSSLCSFLSQDLPLLKGTSTSLQHARPRPVPARPTACSTGSRAGCKV
jgi:hypothetical protein